MNNAKDISGFVDIKGRESTAIKTANTTQMSRKNDSVPSSIMWKEYFRKEERKDQFNIISF